MPSIPYAARQPPSEKVEKPVTVLVTGFGPFLAQFPRNSSWDIASTLPALIPATPENPTPIHIHVHPEPIRVGYNTVVDLIPALLPPANPLYPVPDVILHIGLAASRNYFALEEGAHGRGYAKIADVDGEKFEDVRAERDLPSSRFPNVLKTTFDTADVLARWKTNLGSSPSVNDHDLVVEGAPDVRLSSDAGNFLCGFIYYHSLAHYYSIKKDERPVAFLHVPDLSSSDEKLRAGWKITVALITALVESRRKVGVVDVYANGSVDGKETGAGVQTDNNFA
ncbi:peptidase C15, pyroglutamyl peptidase I-like protein [Cucurbitaria berberidis CBS 394.84]|uniref:Peptidase C15, pyroglutamyl peptidase I-like protein n=1 Tax=Cucurbitaria berberidis CBS 394.84 TaxID=1168544 RepID=A0A9P4GD49_9PLEO|nr:peptidase C15, pyroglutamyl peptidase I-like protein [Cucurbitaria berberidis CBS 394.84]KAF1843718.1 peptidase C15, pyroglutamyl peptidase I-like protein [Cucurbitaria berberidis CBS 394.84]